MTMDNIEQGKRDSLIDGEAEGERTEKLPPPPDKFFLVALMVLTLGLTSLLATSFVITANDYWMYKFKDPSTETYNASNRTILQSNFTAGAGVALSVPAVVGLILVLTVAQKIKSRTRIVISYATLVVLFFILTLFVAVNTDSWQVGFFAIVMGIMAIMSILFIILTSSLIVSIPRLPQSYMKLFLYGQGASGIFSAILQIISLAIGQSPTSVALIYFGSGTALYAVSFALYVISKYLPMYQHYVNEKAEDVKRPAPKLMEMKTALVQMWPLLIIMALATLGQTVIHPNITSLIVSQDYASGSEWSQKYFVPVITFLVADIIGVIGRAFSTNIITKKNSLWFMLLTLVRVLVFPPLFAYCNVQTSSRSLDTVFGKDWEYILILTVFVFTGGYVQAAAVLSLPNFRKEGDSLDLYYLLLQVFMTLFGLATAPLGVLMVNLL